MVKRTLTRAQDKIIQIEDVSRKFGCLWALRGVSFSIKEEGQAHFLLGHNGAGKTTLFKILLGLLKPTQGRVTIAGYDAWDYKQGLLARSRMGVMMQTDGLYEKLSAWENLELVARIYGIRNRNWKNRAEELLEKLNLLNKKNEAVENWSAGMKRKLAILRAVLHEPEIIILDEPTAGLDAVTKHTIRNLLKELISKKSATLLVATQDLYEAEKIATHISFIRQGKVMYTGSLIEVYNHAQIRKYRLSQEVDSLRFAELFPHTKIISKVKDQLGQTILVRYQGHVNNNFDNNKLQDNTFPAPVSLEEVYIELTHRWEDEDEF